MFFVVDCSQHVGSRDRHVRATAHLNYHLVVAVHDTIADVPVVVVVAAAAAVVTAASDKKDH